MNRKQETSYNEDLLFEMRQNDLSGSGLAEEFAFEKYKRVGKQVLFCHVSFRVTRESFLHTSCLTSPLANSVIFIRKSKIGKALSLF